MIYLRGYKFGTSPKYSRLDNLNLAQDKTIELLKNRLRISKIALMIRPTGFGKTYTLIKLCEESRYKKILYMYPTNIIKDSIFEEYHVHGTDANGNSTFKFAATEEEHQLFPDLPYIEFVSYAKMLLDWRNAQSLMGISDKEWEKYPEDRKRRTQEKWMKRRFSDIDLLILDEAHVTGAEGFMEYWPCLHHLAQNRNKLEAERLHIVGATATPLRTSVDVDIEKDIFYYVKHMKDPKNPDKTIKKKVSAKIEDFSIVNCWDCGILPRPIYTKGVLDKDSEQVVLDKALYDNLIGSKSNGASSTIGRNTKKAGAVHIVTSPYLNAQRKLYESEAAKMKNGFNGLPTPSEVIRSGLEESAPMVLADGGYMRFLVFYQNTEDLIKNHEQINNALTCALDIADGNKYHTANISYIVTNEKAMSDAGIPVSSVQSLSERTKQLKSIIGVDKDGNAIEYDSSGQVDIIHSIDVLNMGYHVGKVTGVIIKRATGSEIKFYQEIGRCMSVTDASIPLIVDFSNADAELYHRSSDTLRDEAVDRIREFISNCKVTNNASELNSLYTQVKMHIAMDKLPDELVEYYYFDRYAPIYFIKGIAEAMNCSESVKSIAKTIFEICLNKYSESDLKSDIYSLSEIRLNASMKTLTSKSNGLGGVILQVDDAVNELLKQVDGGDLDA